MNPLHLNYKALRGEREAKIGLVKIVRAIADLFGVDKVLYCADSLTKTAVLSDMAMDGKSLEEIIHIGQQKFGNPHTDFLRAIDETYFVDDGNFEI